MHNATSSTSANVTRGLFHYLAAGVQSSLVRNGRVLTRRDADGSDGGSVGVDLEAHELEVHDGRLADCTLARSGFELHAHPVDELAVNFFDHADVVRRYYPHCASLLREITGARVFVFDHNVRSATAQASGRRVTGGQRVQGPAHVVHGDYTLTGAPQRLRDLARPPSGNDSLRGQWPAGQPIIPPEMVQQALDGERRFAIINLWRSIAPEPVQIHPLALCDAQCVAPSDLVVFEIHYPDRIGENYFAKRAEAHRFYYYPRMVRDEALLIKQWDSHGTLARTEGEFADATAPAAPSTFSFHTAFQDLHAPPDAPDRLSIEVRCMVIYD